MKLRLVTLNAGLLSALRGRIETAPFVSERLHALPDELRRLNADIVALQEVYKQSHRKAILAALGDVLPYHLYRRKRRNLGIENGLMTLAKFPLFGSLTLFRDATFDERLVDNKGVLSCQVHLSGHSRLTLFNLHTTAGSAFLHPEAPKTDHIRSLQIAQILERAAGENGITILTGDFNAGPGVSDENFRQVLHAGYRSAFDLLHPDENAITWDPANRLNRDGPHRTSPPQRIDHVFLHETDLAEARIRLLASEICCNEETVSTPHSEKVTVSDHFGLLVDLELFP